MSQLSYSFLFSSISLALLSLFLPLSLLLTVGSSPLSVLTYCHASQVCVQMNINTSTNVYSPFFRSVGLCPSLVAHVHINSLICSFSILRDYSALSLSFTLAFTFSICCCSDYLSVCMSIRLWLSASLFLSFSFSVCLSVSLYTWIYIYIEREK